MVYFGLGRRQHAQHDNDDYILPVPHAEPRWAAHSCHHHDADAKASTAHT